MKAPATDLAALCRRLESLGAGEPSVERRAELVAGLRSKWDGAAVTAARALSKWGDLQSTAAIREVLVEKAKLSAGWSTAGAMADALARHLRAQDLNWVVPFCLKESHPHYRPSLFQLLLFTPKSLTLKELRRLEGAAGVNPKDLRHAIQTVEMHSQNHAA